MEIISNFLIFWFYLGLISLILLPFRPDWHKIQCDLRKLLFQSLLHFIITSLIGFLFMPFILIDSLISIFRNDV